MQEAFLVISKNVRQRVRANEVGYSDYSRIFQCPRCGATLTWRAGHLRNGKWIRETFVHPEGNPQDCSLRVPFAFSEKSSSRLTAEELIEKDQSSKRLERAFLQTLLNYESPGVIRSAPTRWMADLRSSTAKDRTALITKFRMEYNKQEGVVHDDPDLFISYLNLILKASQTQKIMNQKINEFSLWLFENSQNIEEFSTIGQTIRKTTRYPKNSRIRGVFPDRRIIRDKPLKIEASIVSHCRQVRGIIKYLVKGASDDLRKNFLEIVIWGDEKLPVPPEYAWYTVTAKRKPQVDLISGFCGKDLLKISKDPWFLKSAFAEYSRGAKSSGGKLVDLVIFQSLEAIVFCDWSLLPTWYY